MMTKKILLSISLFILMLVLVGCQTVSGIGGDIKWTAEATADLIEGN